MKSLNDLLKLDRKELMKKALVYKLSGKWTLDQYKKILKWWELNNKKKI